MLNAPGVFKADVTFWAGALATPCSWPRFVWRRRPRQMPPRSACERPWRKPRWPARDSRGMAAFIACVLMLLWLMELHARLAKQVSGDLPATSGSIAHAHSTSFANPAVSRKSMTRRRNCFRAARPGWRRSTRRWRRQSRAPRAPRPARRRQSRGPTRPRRAPPRRRRPSTSCWPGSRRRARWRRGSSTLPPSGAGRWILTLSPPKNRWVREFWGLILHGPWVSS